MPSAPVAPSAATSGVTSAVRWWSVTSSATAIAAMAIQATGSASSSRVGVSRRAASMANGTAKATRNSSRSQRHVAGRSTRSCASSTAERRAKSTPAIRPRGVWIE